MKKVLKIIGIIITIFIIVIFYLSYTIEKNNQLLEETLEKIKKNYQTQEPIISSNEFGNYYIIKTTNEVIVLTKDYKEVLKEKKEKLNKELQEENLIYKTNQLMYEKTITTDEKITYQYYDAIKGTLLKETVLEIQK